MSCIILTQIPAQSTLEFHTNINSTFDYHVDCQIHQRNHLNIFFQHLSSWNKLFMMFRKKNEPPEERTLLCENIWSEILVNLTDHLIHLNIKLQGKNKLFPNLINHINAFKMKLKLFIPQLKNESSSQQIEGAVDIGNWENLLKRWSYFKTFFILLKKKTEFWHL